MYCFLMSPPSLFPLPPFHGGYSLEKPQTGLPPGLLHAQREAWGWISDWLGCNIMPLPTVLDWSHANDY